MLMGGSAAATFTVSVAESTDRTGVHPRHDFNQLVLANGSVSWIHAEVFRAQQDDFSSWKFDISAYDRKFVS